MIASFADKRTEKLFRLERVPAFQAVERAALRKLAMLHAAVTVEDLRMPPGNRLEALSGDRAGQWSIRINDQWRLCFRWEGNDAHDVEICDYH
ncbi:type II toxin-antitoxin system RelE/ParE family toxin [Pseudotabrizicola algicola]|uniref:Type II toxin-antitoxin system RelE/ParE family toxin n=1 Tax=Pseudotabrizicola algicola TaxID=2709381 RepID=A0A6B3RRN4_9RHOB|nr:type II toxin-antitoxin system RelE/ParE family toxin [Pseudotabrizicola algicola]NEX47963.1 type II toxin-antitoxin system RelE/ParE family toxin [Pseudotabrizicola algicola]